MSLRKHQADMSNIVDAIISGCDHITNVLLKATPGSGKSAIAPIASRLIDAGLADAICWICPRKSLQVQGERNFIDPFFRKLLGHRATVRSATNDTDPCRGHSGFITTYQALGVDEDNTVLNDFKKKRYILLLDEIHHCDKYGIWAKSIAPLVGLATFKIFMTGTIFRGDDSQIAFIDYDTDANGDFVPVMKDTETTRIIEYTRTDALQEHAIIPLRFHLHDGVSQWKDKEGRARIESFDSVSEPDSGAALFTALKTEYANELLEITLNHWRKHCYDFPGSKLLVVTASLEHAKAAGAFLTKHCQRHSIATSHDSSHAQEMIKQFKGNRLDILVTVSMAYEGVDVPGISHIACLTHIRSQGWIEQAVGRAVRIDPRFPYERQTGYIFAPDDPFFRKIVKQIESEQAPAAKMSGEKDEKSGKRQIGLFGEDPAPGSDNRYRITPVGSKLTGQRELPLGGIFSSSAPAPSSIDVNQIKTPSEIESDLRDAIDDHVKRYAFANRYTPKRINSEIKNEFGKAREEMSGDELKKAMEHIKKFYPLNRVRGTGIPRVPTKAVAWP